jgi:hypothetical protein
LSFLKDAEYRKWLEEEAAKVGSDGCTCAAEWKKICCLEHDLSYYHGKNPRWAYYLKSWTLAYSISRLEADNHFMECSGGLSWWRWPAVRIGGWLAWKKHRLLRP